MNVRSVYGGVTSMYFVFAILVALATLTPLPTHAATSIKEPNNLGLVGYWSFNEGTSTKANDYSGNRNTGTFVGTPTWTSGKLGKALSFDGSTQYAVVGTPSAINLVGGADAFSVSAWVQTTLTAEKSIITKGCDRGAIQYSMRVSSTGKLLAIVKNSAGFKSTGTKLINDGKWHHVVVSVPTAGTLTFYVDGVVDAFSSGTGAIGTETSTCDFVIGASRNNNNSDITGLFRGSIDEARVYKRALTAAQVQSLYQSSVAKLNSSSADFNSGTTLSNGLVGYWSLDASTINWATGRIADKSTTGNTALLTGIATTSGPAAGAIGGALNFDGVSSYLEAPTNAAYDSTTATWSFWFKSNQSWNVGTNHAPYLFGRAFPVGSVSGLGFNGESNGRLDFFVKNNITLSVITTTASYNDGKWHHAVGVVTGNSNMSLYVDDVFRGSTTPPAGWAFFSSPVRMGISNDSYWSIYPGALDELRIYNRALSSDEIKQLYYIGRSKMNASSQSLTQGTTLKSGLIGYWTFDGVDTTTSIADKSGQGNNGYFVGGSTSSAKTIGKMGQALRFNASAGYVDTSLTSNTNFSNKTFTVSMWLRGGGGYLVTKGYHAAGWAISTAGNGTITVGVKDSSDTIAASRNSSSVLSQSGWSHVVAVITTDTTVSANNDAQIYINGVLNQGSVTRSGNPYNGDSSSVHLGARDANEISATTMDDVRIYNRGLTAAEIKQLYNLGR